MFKKKITAGSINNLPEERLLFPVLKEIKKEIIHKTLCPVSVQMIFAYIPYKWIKTDIKTI